MKNLKNFIIEKYLIDIDSKDETPDQNDPSTWQKDDILVGTMGYSMTLIQFFKILRRTSKKFDVIELGQKIVKGDGMQGEAIADENKTGKKLSGRLNKYGSVIIDSYRCRLWDGNPVWFTHLD